MNKLKIISLNARGLKNKTKRRSIFKYLKSQQIDIACIQEAHITKNDKALWEKEWGGRMFYNEGTNRSQGEVIFVNKRFGDQIKVEIKEQRILMVKVNCENFNFYLANVYSPNNGVDKSVFFEQLQQLLIEYKDDNLIVVGDFNCVSNNTLDIISGNPHRTIEVQAFNKMRTSLQLTDIWRVLHKDEKDFTWSRQNPFVARRLDYCFLSDSVISDCISCEHRSIANTDHKTVEVVLNSEEFRRGPGYWKFNNSFLKDTEFVRKMNEILDQQLNNPTNINSYADTWEMCKVEIRGFCSEYGNMVSNKKRNEQIRLHLELKEIEKDLISKPFDKLKQAKYVQVKQKIEIEEIAKVKGAQTRARVKWIEEGERSTKYFFHLEKARAKRKIITRLCKESGEVITDQSKILDEQVSFYKKLYSQTTEVQDVKSETDAFLENLHIPHLDNDEAETCEGMVSLEEATVALKRMRNGSAPGNDGLTVEFLKFFWNRIGKTIVNSFNDSFIKGELSYTQKQGVITLLHKSNELDRDKLTNWRPITLTNSDYKLLAKVLAERLGNVIDKLVSKDQVGYIKGRQISTIIRTMDDAINYLNKTNKSGYLLAVDFSKAFDSISKSFLLHAFKIFGFGNTFQKWVSILMQNTTSSINHGGWVSEYFDVACGIRQGCPFSPLAFVLAVELLAIKIRNHSIVGIEVPSLVHGQKSYLKIKQMADDTTLFLKDKNDMIQAENLFNVFQSFSGLKLNAKKTKALKIGRNLREENLPFLVVDTIKILGIHLQNSKMARDIEDNWKHRISKVKSLITEWSKRDLSILGKVLVIKAFLLSQFTYVMQAIGLPNKVLTEINTMLYRFLWKKKYNNKKAFEKVKRKVLEANHDEGGIKMINLIEFQEHLNLQWVGKLFYATDTDNWTQVPLWHLGKLGNRECMFNINCRSSEIIDIEKINNDFWKQVWTTYLNKKSLITETEVSETNFGMQQLFNNSLVKYKNKVVFFRHWINQGITQVKDIIHPNYNRLMTRDEVQEQLDQNRAITFFQYNTIINAIPRLWQRWLQNGRRGETVIQTCDASLFNQKPKEIRGILMKNKERVQPTACAFWDRKFGIAIDNFTWSRAVDTTNETRLRVLHWKILHNIYPTNILLNKMQVTENNKCSYCPGIVDFIEHFFFECPLIEKFWKYVERKINVETNCNLKLSSSSILFGINGENLSKEKYVIVNLYILVGKMCISIFKKTKSNCPLDIIFEQELAVRKTGKKAFAL